MAQSHGNNAGFLTRTLVRSGLVSSTKAAHATLLIVALFLLAGATFVIARHITPSPIEPGKHLQAVWE